MQKLNISQNLLVTITQLILFVISIFFIQKNEITIGGLTAFNGYAAMVLGPFVSLGRNWQNIQNGLVSIIRAEKILKTEREIYNPPNAISFKNIRGEIEFKNVSFAYKNSKESVLKNISFKINPGEKIALVGKSGVGKTTLIELILGFYFPQKGEVLIDGVNIKKLNLLNYRKRIAIVPQEPTLFNESIKYNIKYGKESASFSQIKKAAELAYADEFIEKFPKKYNQIVGWRGVKLSIGQKQIIALARAFLKNPDVLILDEPTSALDTKSEYLIKKSLKKLMENKTAIIIAHRLSTIKEVDKIFVIDEGEIKEIGTHSELLNNPNSIYKSFYDLQIKDFLT
jgi:ABC-type multidrug transport system fused ATPase/permease subunit